jgi:nicotinamide-nucleotide amidase
MFEGELLPVLKARYAVTSVTTTRVLKTFGFAEAKLGEIISSLPAPHEGMHVGYRPTFPEIHLALTATAGSTEEAEAWIAEYEGHIRQAIGTKVWGTGVDSFPGVVGDLLRQKGWKLATAESCTGGLTAKLLTDVAGSSDYFERGFVTYTNEAKVVLLGAPPKLFAPEGAGAVSEECALAMAEGARERAGVDVALSATGIAGPDGGTEDKPVGTVCVGLATADHLSARRYCFPGPRHWVRTLASYVALERLRRFLLGVDDVTGWRPKG